MFHGFEDLDTIKTGYFPGLRDISTQNMRPLVCVLNFCHIYLGKTVRFLIFVLGASFAYIIF